jgi:hypothetical protein
MIHSKQIKQARAVLGISIVELSLEIEPSLKTIQRLEKDQTEVLNAKTKTLAQIKNYFISRGVRFLFAKEGEDEMEGIGVRYYKSKDTKFNP